MKFFLAILVVLTCLTASGQDELKKLSSELTVGKLTELEKVTSIFRWITSNISYKTKNSKQRIIGAATKRHFTESDLDDSPLLPLNERVALRVLSMQVAVCDGYARLFTTLCDYAGIKAEIIVGYARSGFNKPVSKFGVNHYWNAVRIDGQWHLVDATWASGYLSSKGDEFIRDFDQKYFLSSPSQFIKDHYPDDPRWTLLDDSRVPEEFRRSPFKQKSYSKYEFTSYTPSSGIIDAFLGDTLYFKLETPASVAARDICPDLLIDSAIFSHSPGWVFLHPEKNAVVNAKHQSHYMFAITNPQVEWLYLLYNDDVVLRYKVNVRKRKS